MAEKGTASHKRSKSALALSLLHRDKSKADAAGDDRSATVSDADSDSGSPISASQQRGFGGLRSSRNSMIDPLATPKPDTTAMTQSRDSGPSPQGVGETIEQSVRKFKLFEILRSGDAALVARAVKETSELPTIDEGEERTGANSNTLGGLEGTTILHLAIQCADPPVVEQILSVSNSTPGVNLDVNAQDREGNTPLHLASTLGRSSTVRLLLEQKDINDAILNYRGRSPLDLARTPDIFQQLQLFRSLYVDAKVKEVQALVSKGSYDELEKMLIDPRVESVLDVNGGELATEPSTIQSGGTLLHEAARNKDLKLIQLLLMHGADPFRRDRKGRLPQDITKDDRTRNILKRSPAAAVAQRGIQEKAVLGATASASGESVPGGKEAREMKGYLKKWTNYTSGYKLRWFVLEDGVLSYYKHQDDAGSACRGAINMKITKLHMDPQDKTRFEIQGKSSVKYHLKANHAVEANRWVWALNNAIQWTKDEAKEEERQRQQTTDRMRKAKLGETAESNFSGKGLAPASSVGISLSGTSSRVSFQDYVGEASSNLGDDGASIKSYEGSVTAAEVARSTKDANPTAIAGDYDEEEEYGDDASSHDVQPASKDAFNVTAHSASLQLNLLGQVSAALQAESSKGSSIPISDPTVAQAISTYESAVRSLEGLVGDLLKIARDRDAYWQYRLDREADVRRMWEDSMARVAKEQEELEGRIGESEDKRKRTKRALREALEGTSAPPSRPGSQRGSQEHIRIEDTAQKLPGTSEFKFPPRRKSIGIREAGRRRSTIADLTNLSDSDSEEDEEFFDAVDAGEVEIGEMPPALPSPPIISKKEHDRPTEDLREVKKAEILPSFKGYEDPVRTRLKLDADNRPKISLWGILKSMIGKDMTKMTLPVSFNEPTSLLQRVTEDMEYTELLDTAADRTDSTERMLYVAAFAASEYASTIGRVAKPFNPLLGETYEYVRPDKGYRFFIEQVSHHPPIGAAWAESPKWDYFGESAVKSKFYGKSFDINPLGTWFLRLRPSTGGTELYTWKKVTSSVIGIITGNPTVDNYGPMEIRNHTTGEVCHLDFKPRGWKASSAYQVSGKVLGVDGKTRWSIGGRWNDKIYARLTPGFEDEVLASAKPGGSSSSRADPSSNSSNQAFLVWEAHPRPPNIPFNLTPFVVTFQHLPPTLKPLLPPTDTRLRPDQRAMEDGEYDRAATEKNRVEEKQRAKRREREAAGEVFEPRWFRRGREEVTGEECWVATGEYWKRREMVAQGGGGGAGWEGVEDIF